MSQVVDLQIVRAFRALVRSLDVHRIVSRRTTRLTRVSRRLRYAARCGCGKLATGHFSEETRLGRTTRLKGDCADCWARGRVMTQWFNVFSARQALVRRNIPHGDLRKHLLKWVWDVEQTRGDLLWRRQPDPPRPPGPRGGGLPLPARHAEREPLRLTGAVLSERKAA